MDRRIDVGVLGATGMVGQQFVVQLANHPWFRLTWLGASERSAGQRYGDAAPWRLPTAPSREIADLKVEVAQPARPSWCSRRWTRQSRARSSRPLRKPATWSSATHATWMDADVPLLVPEINGDHLALVARQRDVRGWSGLSSPTRTARPSSCRWPSRRCARSA